MHVSRSAGYLLVFAAAANLGACANFERFLPPGFVRYEDIAGDKPTSPEIKQSIDRRLAGREAKFPILAEQPQSAPDRLPASEQAEAEQSIADRAAALEAAVAADRAAADADRADADLEASGASVLEAVEADREVAARERRNNPAATAK